MKQGNKKQLALIVAVALAGLAQAKAETISITSQFTPLENLSVQDRINIQKHVEAENPTKQFDWENEIIGKNEGGQIEVREKATLMLQAVENPTCSK